jgi:hypothetical protein
MHIFSGQGPKLAIEIAYRDEEIDPGCADYPGKLALDVRQCQNCWFLAYCPVVDQLSMKGSRNRLLVQEPGG